MTAADQRSVGALRRTTGKDRDEWFTALDGWGAAGRPYGEIAHWLSAQGLSDWWAQKIIVEYEQERGVREPGARRDGTFAGGASKTVGVTVDRLFAAVLDPALRRRWLPDMQLDERNSQPPRLARFDVGDGTRLNVGVATTGEARSQIAVEQTHLPTGQAAAAAKVYWRERLSALKQLLEAQAVD